MEQVFLCLKMNLFLDHIISICNFNKKMETKIFLNLPVKELNKSMEFFTQLGFTFNPKFTDDKAACMIIGDKIFSMLITEEFYKTFTNKTICDARKNSEVLISISVESREKVDEMIANVVKAGGSEYMETKDYGWMYHRCFLDLDQHHWEVFFMDESQMPVS